MITMYFEAIRHDTTYNPTLNYKCNSLFYQAEVISTCIITNQDIKLNLYPSFIHFTTNGAMLSLPLHKQPSSQNYLQNTETDMISEAHLSKFCPLVSLHSFHIFCFTKPQDTLCILQSCRHFLDCSDLGGNSQQLNLHTFMQELFSLTVSQ